jgi:hypothetical protein
MAYQLHSLYCAFEYLFEVVADAFERHTPDKSKYHMELPKRMALTLEENSPPLLSQKSYTVLDNIRSFRYWFRHAPSYKLDRRKVRIVAEVAAKLRSIYRKDINAFLDSFPC